MKLPFLLSLPILMALLFFKIQTIQSQSQASIIINNAETTAAIGLNASAGFASVLITAPAMVLHAFAEATIEGTLLPPPTTLAGLLNQHPPNVLFAFSEASYQHHLSAISADLQAQLSTVEPYTIFAFTEASYGRTLHYPATLINDTTPPQITPAHQTTVGGITYLQWRTSEFTTSTLRYGTASGVYTELVIDELFALDHFFNMMALAPGQIYYVQIISKDRNGNETMGNEFTVVRITTQNLYLPLIRKR